MGHKQANKQMGNTSPNGMIISEKGTRGSHRGWADHSQAQRWEGLIVHGEEHEF